MSDKCLKKKKHKRIFVKLQTLKYVHKLCICQCKKKLPVMKNLLKSFIFINYVSLKEY